jgi:uncharacterized membrane-anchored protein
MGEATSDFLGNVSIPLAGAVGVVGFALGLWLQFRAPRYTPFTYWFAIAMVAVFGTMAADVLHVVLNVPYLASTAFYAAALAVIFYLWHRREGTLSIHSIDTRRREKFYWLTVLATFALGTAAGDLTATSLNLGFFTSAVVFAAIILIPLVGWWKFNMNDVFAFWFAYVLTRPLGASIADYLGKPHNLSGAGFGDGTVSLVSAVAIVCLVSYLATRRAGGERTIEAEDLLTGS